jgi:hypothetical protein
MTPQPPASEMPRLTGARIHGEFCYVVRWPDGTSAWWFRRWQARAAQAGWTPPPNGAHPVPGEPFRFEMRKENGHESA